MPKQEFADITVVIDADSNECLYLDGVAWESKGEITVYVTDLVAASGGFPIKLKHEEIDFVHEEWPDSLAHALINPGDTTMRPNTVESLAKERATAGPL